MPVLDRVLKAWNAFRAYEQSFPQLNQNLGPSSSSSSDPSRTKLRFYNERSIITSIYTRIGIDVASLDIRHVKLDEQKRYESDIDGPLTDCLSLEPNVDQTPRAFKQDIVTTLFDKGHAVIVPVDTAEDPTVPGRVDIYTMRVGEVVQWYPKHVRVSVYNELTGFREEIILEKNGLAIIYNPLYSVMNEPNSTLQRLIHKLTLLDAVDEQSSSGKLDLIIQLPYVIKSEARRKQAQDRREEVEFQLKGSQYGIAYTDGSEKITQLNRPAENNLLKTVEYLTNMLYGELGITADVMNGTADEKTMLNYYNRTVEPIITSITEAMQKSFIGHVGTRRNEKVMFFRDPFRLVPVEQIADIADKLARNEVLTSNEIRGIIGFAPSKDPKADQLVNSNMPQPTASPQTNEPAVGSKTNISQSKGSSQNGS